MQLYAIDTRLLTILDRLDETGELGETDLAEINALDYDRKTKINAILQYRQDRLARACALQAEIDRMTAAKRAEDGKAEWLKGYVLRSMQILGELKLETDLFRASVCRNSAPSVTVSVPVESLPTSLQRVKTIVEADKAAMTAKFKAGETLPEGVTVAYGTHLRIT